MVKSNTKKIIAILCVLTILLPYMSEVLAVAKLTHQSENAYLYAKPERFGGNESSGTLPSNLVANYDTAAYKYSLSGTTVFKVVQAGDTDGVDALYCIDGDKSFPVVDGGLLYTNEGDFKNQSNAKVTALGLSEDNYKAIKWLFDNFYLPKDSGATTYKDTFLRKAFSSDIHNQDDLNLIKSLITDDDIEVVQQWALWYFSNPDTTKYQAMRSVSLEFTDVGTSNVVTTSISAIRQELCEKLFDYLVDAAKVGQDSSSETYPSIAVTSDELTSNVVNLSDGAYYAVGPFKVNSGTVDATITLTDGTNPIASTNYKIKIDGESDFTTTPVDEILNKNYYIYVPVEDNTIPRVQLNLSYNKAETKVSLWENSVDTNQPLVLITRENEPVNGSVYKELPALKPDLAMRKYIIKVNDTIVNRSNNSTNNTPEIDASTIDTEGGAQYKGSKEALTVKIGDVITYELRVYNEGIVKGSAEEIIDYLPVGLTLTPNSTINTTYGWTASANGRIVRTTYTAGKMIDAYKAAMGNNLDSEFVQLQCTVGGNIDDQSILTNIAEIYSQNPADEDSEANSIKDVSQINMAAYTGADTNKTELNDKDYYYKGLEDDDDFEKVIVDVPDRDFALRKYIVDVDGTTINRSLNNSANQPQVVLTDLVSGTDSTAKYLGSKEPIEVNVGSVITYEIRVYNEGNRAGTVDGIVDYLPTGLTLTPNSTINQQYGWQQSQTNPNAYVSTYLADKTIGAYEGGSTIISGHVQIQCSVTGNFAASTTLTNIAEIVLLDQTNTGADRDSQGSSIDISNIDLSTYTGNSSNPADLSQKDNFYKGIQDDDDFEKVVINPTVYDLNLKKFITKINGQELEASREPVVNVAPLKNGAKNADYTLQKAPITVQKGDVITYKIRVYNEGSQRAYDGVIKDYLPDGLALILDYKGNENWEVIGEGGISRAITSIPGLAKNLSLDDFNGNPNSFDDVRITSLRGYPAAFNNQYADVNNPDNILEPFDIKNGTQLDYCDVEITCIVIADSLEAKNYQNIAEISTSFDEDGEPIGPDGTSPITDRDSTPGSMDPLTYPNSEKNPDGSFQDDYDVEVLAPAKFDLALQKFITGVNNIPSQERIPDVAMDNETGELVYTHPRVPLKVSNGDLVAFTIRAYNEGGISGYASEIEDYIPQGLEFVSNDSINIKYGWKMIDKDGNETTDISKAVSIKTTYLSKEESEARNENNLLKVFDATKVINTSEENANPDYRDIQVVFRINSEKAKVTIRNIAEITENTDESGEPIQDIDSTPDSVNPDNYPESEKKPDGSYQDDNDYDDVYIKAFDLALEKFISKVNARDITNRIPTIQIVNNEIVYNHPSTPLNTADGDLITYTIRVYNEGEIDGYAAEIEDNIPDGLIFVKDNEINKKYEWVVEGNKVKTEYLSKEKSEDNLIKAFDSSKQISETGNDLNPDYKDVQIVFKIDISKVKDPSASIINIAEISRNEDPDGNPIEDVDSIPDNNNPDEDDLDKERLNVGKFDLSLEKFITKVNDEDIDDREPIVTKSNRGLSFSHPSSPLAVANNDVIFYTIRVYNEGSKAGYAEEVLDNLPTGLVYLDDNETNIKYGWKLYDKKGNPTNSIEDAVTIRTNYLSKEESEKRGEDNLLLPYDEAKDINRKNGEANPDYRDVIIVFQVSEKDMLADASIAKARLIKNYAEISDDADENGNPVEDNDSTPGNGIESEDDLDDENIHIKYFDLALKKELSKVIISVDGKVTEIDAKSKDALMKVEVNKRRIGSTTIQFVYKITVENQGEIEGYATEITDYIPEGLEFNKADNPEWMEGTSSGTIITNSLAKKLLKPGESASTNVTLKWKNSESNLGQKVNVAEISSHYNDSATEDIDSTPNNKVVGEDDLDMAPVLLSISTGLMSFVKDYLLILTGVLIIMAVIIIRRRNIVMSKRVRKSK